MERSAPGPSVPPSRDDVALQDLFDTCYGLGDHHQVEGKSKYLYRQRDECLTSLQDLETAVAQDTGIVRAKLGEWQVLPRKIVPLLTSYIEDSELASHVLKLMVLLTTRVGNYGPPPVDHRMLQEQEREQLCHLQEYKEAFTNSAVFTMLVRLLVEALDGEGRTHLFKDVLFLLRNLVSVPDPGPGDTGFTPLRRRMQMTFLRNFCEEGVLAFLSLIANELTAQQQEDTQQVWALADILYHVCTHFDPEELLTSRKNQGKPRSDLAELLARDKADQKLLAPQSSRHSRFGTLMHTMSSDGSMMLSSSVMQNSIIQKSSALLKREFRNPEVSGKKTNMFHNLFFVDLGEGSVREYNQINPHVRGVLDDRMYHPQKVLQGYRAFFEQLCSTSFSSLVSIMRSSCNANPAKEGAAGTEFDMPHLLNFVSWFLEFHRVQHATQVEEAKKKSSPPPDMDIAVIQGAIDLDMIQFTTARLRDFGKGAHIHSSFLVVVLRALSAQVQTIKVITECTGSDTRDCGDLLVTHTVKEDVLGNVSWIMKNFNSATHDPRILSYSVEVWHLLTMLMERRGGERGAEAEFQVERLRGVQMSRSTTSVEKEIAGLADSRVVENLFHLLEKYRRHTPLLQSMLVKLIRSIMDAQPTNIVLFFELSYFMRIQRIMTDPLLTSNKNAEKYKDILGLLRFVLREFFTCAETNKCVFAELLFRKVQESQKEQVESCAVEFGAILSNYENEGYRQVLDRMSAGDTVKTIRKQRADVMKGQGWTEEEDAVLRQRYAMYASHPLAADLLAADLPEDNKRTPLQVRRRLIELELMPARGPGGRAAAAEDEPVSKKAKVDGGNVDMPAGKAAGKPAPPTSFSTPAGTEQDEEMLEEDLERLLDAAYDSLPADLGIGEAGEASTVPNAPAPTAMDKADGTAASTAMDEASVSTAPTAKDEDTAAEAKASAVAPTAMEASATGVPTTVDEASATAAPTMMDKTQMGATAASEGQQQPLPKTADDMEVDPERVTEEGRRTCSLSQGGKTQPMKLSQDDLELELERLIDAEMPSAETGASQGGQEKVKPSQDDLERDLERLMEAEMPSAETGASQGGQEKVKPSQDDLERDLERLMEAEMPSAEMGASQGGQEKVIPSQDDLERDLERLMEAEVSGSPTEEGPSQGRSDKSVKPSPDDLELDLERLMDEASAASRAGA